MENFWLVLSSINQFFQNLGAWLTTPMKLVTFSGQEEFFLLIIPLLYWSLDAQTGLRVGIMLLLSNGINTFFKFLFHTPRPFWVNRDVQALVKETSFGLPSGHAQNAASIWGILAYSVKKTWFTWLSIILIFLTGISRIYLGVHFLTDVLLGWLIGGLLLWAFIRFETPVLEWFKRLNTGRQVILAIFSSSLFFLVPISVRSLFGLWEPAAIWPENILLAFPEAEFDPFDLSGSLTLSGTWLGLLLGLILLLSRNSIYTPAGSIVQRVLRFIIGLVGIAILWFGLGEIFPDGVTIIPALLRILRYALLGFWISALAPLVFRKLKLADF